MFRTLLNKWRVYIVEIIKNVQDILGVIIFENTKMQFLLFI